MISSASAAPPFRISDPVFQDQLQHHLERDGLRYAPAMVLLQLVRRDAFLATGLETLMTAAEQVAASTPQ